MKKLVLFLCLLSPLAWGEGKDPFASDTRAYLGGFIGLSIPNAPDTTERAALAFAAGAKLSDEFSVGGFYLTSSKGERANNTDFEFRYAAYGLEANYHFEGSAVGAHLGGRVGLARVSKDPRYQTYTTTPLVMGIQAGYDKMVTPNLSLGGEVSTLLFNGGKQDPSTGLQVESFGALSFLAALKVWL